MDANKFKVGEKWLTRSGEVRVISEVDSEPGTYPVFSNNEAGLDSESYTANGKYYRDDEESDKDLVRPVLAAESTTFADEFRDRLIVQLAQSALTHMMTGSDLMDFIDTIMARRAGKDAA